MRAQILEWLRRDHSHPARRTLGGIAAFLQFDEEVVRRELDAMASEGLVRVESSEGYDVYVAR